MSSYWNKMSPMHSLLNERVGKAKGGRVGLRDRAFAKGGRVGLKHGGSKKAWKKHDDSKAEAAHEMAKRGKKSKTFFSDTGKSHGKGHRIRDTKSVSEENRKAYKAGDYKAKTKKK